MTDHHDPIQPCREIVQTYCADNYLANLLLPDTIRDDVTILYAFHASLLEAIERVHEPMAGEIRLQWWADIVLGERKGEASGHPVASQVQDLVFRHPSLQPLLEAKARAHTFDLYQDPMEDGNMLEGYLGETRSYLFQAAALIAGAEIDKNLAEACGHAGMADGLTMILCNLARHRIAESIYVPLDMLEEHDLTRDSFLGVPDRRHEKLVKSLTGKARYHRKLALQAVRQLEGKTRSVFRTLRLIPLYLKKASRDRRGLYSGMRMPLQITRQIHLILRTDR